MNDKNVPVSGTSTDANPVTFIWLRATSAHLLTLADAMWCHLSPDAPHVPKAKMRARMCESGKHFWLFALETSALPAKHPLGMASLFYTADSSVAEIHEVVVDPASRGQHLGEQIVRMLIEHARHEAMRRRSPIDLELSSKPKRVAANTLYLKLGFLCIAPAGEGRDSNHYRMAIAPQVE